MSELVETRELLDAFGDEMAEYWPIERELLAVIAETLQNILIVTLKANGAKGSLPQPLRVPRPKSSLAKAEVKALTMSEYAAEIKSREAAKHGR